MDFKELLTARHSAVNFVKDFVMTSDDFKNIFDLTKTAPSSFNLQYTHYLVVMDALKKQRVCELNGNQHKIQTASAIVIVMGDRDSAQQKNAEKIYGPMKMLKMMDEVEYGTTLQLIENFNSELQANSTTLEVELMRNAGLHAMLFMLSAKHFGFDTCPMHVHSIDELRSELNIPENLQPLMMIAVGKSVDKVRPRGYRKPVDEFVQYNSY